MFDSNNPEVEAANNTDHFEGVPPSEAPETTDELRDPTDAEEALSVLKEASEAIEPEKLDAGRIAKAIFILKNSILTAPARAAWKALPAFVQRDMAMATQSEFGKQVMKYEPLLNPRFYFLPGHVLALFALSGALEFKLTAEEEEQMKAELGENASAAQVTEWVAKKQEEIAANIQLPGEGVADIATHNKMKQTAEEEPELAPVVAAGHLAKGIQESRAGFLETLRHEVHTLEVAEAERQAVRETAHDTKEDAAYSVTPQAHLHPEAEDEAA